jgi:hypothetical protein
MELKDSLLFLNLLHDSFPSCGKKVKLSHHRPGQALGVPGGSGSRIYRQSAHEGGKVFSPMYQSSLPQEGFLVLISVKG